MPPSEPAIPLTTLPRADAAGERAPPVAWVGLLVGATMFTLSATGILWRIDVVSVSAAILAAVVVSVGLARQFTLRPSPSWSLLLLLAPLVLVPLLVATAPPHQWDEVAYGASLPRDYVQAARFFYNADYGAFSAFPGNYEAITTASLVLLGSVTLARVLNAALAVGLGVAAAHLSVRVGAPRCVAPLASVLVLAAPAVYDGTLMIKNDLASAFFQVLTLLALTAYLGQPRWRELALAGLFLGTAAGTKYSSLTFAVSIAPLAAVVLLRGARDSASFWRHAAVFGGAAAVAALPWYGRNLVAFGNPFFPFFNEGLGAKNAFTALHSTLTREMFDGLTGYSFRSGTARSFLEGVGAWFGWTPVVLAPPGVWLAVTRRRSGASLLLAATLVCFGLVTFFAGYWLPRFFLSLLVVASAFAALCIAEIGRALRLLSGRRRATVAVALLVGFVAGSALRQRQADATRLMEALRGDRHEFVRAHVANWDVADWINHHTPPGARVGLGLQLQPFYYLDRPYFHIHPLTEKGNLQALETADQYFDAFRSLDLEWLAVNPWRPGRTYLRSRAPNVIAFRKRFEGAVDALSRDGRLELVARRGPVRIFRVGPPFDSPRGGE